MRTGSVDRGSTSLARSLDGPDWAGVGAVRAPGRSRPCHERPIARTPRRDKPFRSSCGFAGTMACIGGCSTPASPRITEDGEFAGYIGSCIDITDHKNGEIEREALLARERAARAEADAARVAAEHANDVKAQFLAVNVARAPDAAECDWRLRRSAGARHSWSGHRRAARGPRAHPPQPATPARSHQQRPELREDRGGPRRVPHHRDAASTTFSTGCTRWSRRRCARAG